MDVASSGLRNFRQSEKINLCLPTTTASTNTIQIKGKPWLIVPWLPGWKASSKSQVVSVFIKTKKQYKFLAIDEKNCNFRTILSQSTT